VFFLQKGLPLQLTAYKIAKISRLVMRIVILEFGLVRVTDGPGTLQKSTDCQAKQSILILWAVLAAGRLQPDSARKRPQAYRVPSRATSLSVPGAAIRLQRRGLRPASPKRPPLRHSVRPDTDPDPGTAPPPLGAAALANKWHDCDRMRRAQ
jgi:hypothetical protein